MAATATMTSTPLNFPSRDHTTPIRFAAAAEASSSSASPRSRERRVSARSPQSLSTTPSTPNPNAPARHSSLTPTPKPASSVASDAGFSSASQANDYQSIASMSSGTTSQVASEAAANANRRPRYTSRASLDASRPDLSHLESRDAGRSPRQRDARRDASPAAVKPTSHALYHNLALASLSTPELHLASDPMVDIDDHPAAQRGLMGWLGNKRMSESTDVLPLRSGDGYYASLAAVVTPAADRKAESRGRRESHRERKQSSATVRREPLAESSVQASQGSCGSTATLNAATPDTPAAKTSRADKRRSVGNDSSLRHPRTWFSRPRRWSAHSSSSPPPLASSSSAPPSPALGEDVDDSDVSFNPSIASAATVAYNPAASGSATAESAANAFTASAISAAQTNSSLSVDASQRGARSIQENLRAARAFLVAELSQLSPVEMGEDKKRIASLAWYTREQDAESRGLALDPTREMLEFWMSISDGVVLCLVANRIRPGSVDRIDRRDAEWVKADNISRFLRACRDYLGVRSKDLFHPLDLTDATVEGLQRAVHTILMVERVSKARGLTSPIIAPIVQAVAPAVPLRISTSSSRTSRTPPLTPDGSLDDAGGSSDVPFPRGTEQSSPPRRVSPTRKEKVSFPITPSVQQQRQEAERILVSASTRPSPLSDDANVRARRRRSSDIAGSLLSSTRPKGGASITFADSVSRGSDEESRMPYRDRKLSESALSLTGVAEEEMEEVLHSPISSRNKARSPSTPALERRESFGASDDANTSGGSFNASPMARANSQRRISQELNLGVGSGSPGRALRTSSDFEEYRFPTQGSPVRTGPVRRHSARSYVGPSSLNPQRDSSETASPAPSSSSIASTPVRVPFPRALSASDSPSSKRLGRHLSLNTNLASYDASAVVATGSQTPVSPRTGGGPTAQRPVNYRHMRYLSDLQVPKTGQLHTARSDLSIDTAAGVSAVSSRPRYDSEVGSLYTNTIGSFTTQHDDQSLVNTRLGREPSAAPTSKHKLVVVEEGKPNVTYQMGNCIGRGQFGSVYRALNLNSGQMMAVKRIKLEGKSEDEVTQLMHEVDLLKSLAHPSVVKYEGLVRGSDVVSIILEYVENGSLLHTLKAFGNFPEKLVASYVVKILEGLNYLHDMKVVHCDLKAANILTTKNGNVKLSDFGVSLNLKAVENIKNDAIGTPNWMAPEVIELKGASTAADIWSLGCTIIELLTGKPPYGDMLAMSAMWRIVEDDCPPIPDKISEPLRDFLSLCFNKDPTLRPSAEMLFEHHWLQQTWGGHKELRPQDSVPFLRRISADFRKVDIKSLHAAISEATMPEETSVDKTPQQPRRPSDMGRSTSSPPVGLLDQRPDLFYMRSTSAPDAWSRALREVSLQNAIVQPVPGDVMSALTVADLEAAAAARRGSAGSVDMLRSPSMAASNSGERHVHGSMDPSLLDLNSPHESYAEEAKPHSFVKSTFSKAVACKICREPVKKHAVLCEECGLICHASCARRAPASCNLRAQLMMFAGQQAHRSSQDLLRGISPVPSLGPPAMSFTPAASPAPQSPSFGPTFKVPFSNKWKRNSRGTIEPLASPPITPVTYVPGSGGIGSSPSPTPPPAGDVRRRRISLLPGMGLGRARSPSPVDRARGSASIARSFTSSQNGAAPGRANSINYGSVSGSSSISSASQGGQAMRKTASGSSGCARFQHREPSQRASVGPQPEAPRRTSGKGHRASHSVAVLGSYQTEAGLTGSQRTAGDGAITPMPLNESERKRSRRLSAKQDCAVM